MKGYRDAKTVNNCVNQYSIVDELCRVILCLGLCACPLPPSNSTLHFQHGKSSTEYAREKKSADQKSNYRGTAVIQYCIIQLVEIQILKKEGAQLLQKRPRYAYFLFLVRVKYQKYFILRKCQHVLTIHCEAMRKLLSLTYCSSYFYAIFLV